MPGLFSKRRSNSTTRNNTRPLDQSTNSNAAVAASQAFLQRPPSSASLSSAAAAAALRSHTTSPEPVGSIQTKRMVRRGSVSSIGSGSVIGANGVARGGTGRGTLQRMDSGGSMTERTFRSPSPGSRINGTISAQPNAPPVPAIPRNIPTGQQRSSSLDPPQRVASSKGGERAMSLDRNSMQPQPPSSRRPQRLSDVNEEVEAPESSPSVNFSRPRSSHPSSPGSPTPDQQYTHGTGNWFTEPAVAPVKAQSNGTQAMLEQKIARIQAAAGQPVRRDGSVQSSQGTYLTRANQQSSALETPMETVMVYDPSSRTFVPTLRPKPKAIERPPQALPPPPLPIPGTFDPNTRKIVAAPEPKTLSLPKSGLTTSHPERPVIDTDLQPPPRNPARLSPISTSPPGRQLQKQPSVAREPPHEEIISTSVGPAKAYVAPGTQKPRSNSLDVPRASLDNAGRGRGNSSSPSPQRSAHFSPSPVVQAVLHNPPPRDVSPAKPALKHHSPASSIGTSSPQNNLSSVPRSPASETSEASQDVFLGKKKKSVRVSFDEQLHEIEAATAVATPTALNSSVLDDVDDEELMKPRPALPSFGSVRKQRSPAIAEKVTEMAPERHETSSDHAVGGILRNANGIKTQDEPLPPEVTSKESAGYVSDESEDIRSPLATSTPAKLSSNSKTESSTSPDIPKVRDFAAVAEPGSESSTGVPAINLLPPTPGIEEEGRILGQEPGSSPRTRSSFEINLPGGWNKEEEHGNEISTLGGAASTEPSTAATDHAFDVPDEDPIIYSSPQSKSPVLNAINEDLDTDDSAEFSDAAEDLSELDNGGYASLNAIAVSPMVEPPALLDKPTIPITSPPESPSVALASKKGVEKASSHNAQRSGDWSQATAYWSQLSRQQREQIEREHLSSDDEARPPPAAVRKAKKKTTAKPVIAESAIPSAPLSAAPKLSAATQHLQPAMKKSMRAQSPTTPADGEVHMRRSMRTGGGSGMATSLRDGPPPPKQQQPAQRKGGFQQKTMRSESGSGVPASAAGATTVRTQTSPAYKSQVPYSAKTQPKPSAQSASVMSARLQRELTNESDSESSFKKKRRSSAAVANQGKYTMKHSMRGGPAAASAPEREERPVSPTPARGRGRDSFSIRSLSPTGSLFGRKKRVEDVKQSIRGSSVDGGARMTMRNGPPVKSTGKPVKSQKPTTSRFKSRFADSDDEEEDAGPRRGPFRSRFTDSDDEDDDVFIPANLTPVRGIPRRYGQNDGDSTDLEDEDEDDPRKASRQRDKIARPLVPDSADVDKAMELARKKLGIPERPQPESAEGATLNQGSLRNSQAEPISSSADVDGTPERKKRGFMSGFLRRNRGSTASVPQVSSSGMRSPQEAPSSPLVSKAPETSAQPQDELATQPPETIARPQSPVSPSNKLVRRVSGQPDPPRMRRGDSNYSNATAPPAVGDRDGGGNWPLPAVPNIPGEYNGRPNTSDGSPVKAGKAGSVRFDEPEGAPGRSVYSQRTGKKKKFSMLRRAFGLND